LKFGETRGRDDLPRKFYETPLVPELDCVESIVRV